jgi:hypothetical protein
VNRLTDVELLATWERGHAQHALDRALTSLVAATGAPSRALADLGVGERDALLFELHRRWFGTRIDTIATCPACGERVEMALDVDRLSPPGAAVAAGEITVEHAGTTVVCRQPTSRDLATAIAAGSSEEAAAVLTAACTVRAEHAGAPLDPTALPPAVIERMEQALADMTPPAEIALAVSCPACRHGWSAPFDVGEAVWTMIDVTARRLMEEVGGLAERYGWSESGTLALPPARRRYYLERARS